MGVGIAPRDDNGVPALGLWDDATGTWIPLHIGAKVTGADGKSYAKLDVDVTVSVDPLNPQPVSAASGSFVSGSIADLTTALANLATLITNTNKIPASPAQEAGNLATLVTNTADLLADGDHLATIDTSTAAMVPGVQGWIAPAGTGTATTDDSLTFANQVRKVVLYNASANPVPLEFDQVAAATSFPIPPGAFWVLDDILCTIVHVFPSATLPINTTSGLYVKGWK